VRNENEKLIKKVLKNLKGSGRYRPEDGEAQRIGRLFSNKLGERESIHIGKDGKTGRTIIEPALFADVPHLIERICDHNCFYTVDMDELLKMEPGIEFDKII